jgi:hypothetical protein
MASVRKPGIVTPAASVPAPPAELTDQKIVALAERVGRIVGATQGKVEKVIAKRPRTMAALRAKVLKKAKPAVKARGRSGGVVDAPGKKHRGPMPSTPGVKHSDEQIAKGRLGKTARRPQRRG